MLNDGRDPAQTCACCGQAVRSTGTLTIRVEEVVLDLCNQAFAEAANLGHVHVDVAHLIAVFTRSPNALAIFQQLNLDPATMSAASTRWLARMEVHHDAQQLNASAELKALLTQAEARAARSGRTHANLSDVIGLLAELSAPVAQIGVRTPQQTSATLTARTSLLNLLTVSTPAAAVDASPQATPQHISHATTTAREQQTLAMLLARLDRQDEELADLRAALKNRATARARTGQSTSARNPARGQTYLPDIHALSTHSTSDLIYLRRSLRQRADQNRRRRNRIKQRQVEHEGKSKIAAARPWSQRRTAPDPTRERAINLREVERDDDFEAGDAAKRFYLALDDHIERAPSIGPKTAGRLIDAGVATVREFLAADPDALSGAVRAKFITAQRVRDWQAQARLVCTVPFLRGTHAQLLVGAGYPTPDAIIASEPSSLCAAILKFATTRDGQSVLRAGPPPEMERILRWIENAADAEPARAAA